MRNLLKEHKYNSNSIYKGLIINITTQLKEIMKKKGITKKELAEKMKVKPSYITKIFSGQNISLKTFAKVLEAIEADAIISVIEKSQNISKIPDDKFLKILKSKNLKGENEIRNFYNIAA